ncbi:uncharacterized protein N7529_000021 [Penicillium soppii]|uniref:uncharacterized protein n=1 Tax=Penicillium soppii TaxID=69789 RepID=UPI0025469369|nr:uncharacterized protein N7529_000021 [Penicillium soppii]KAJ5881349.1 hypothetical protein N7529_000021 [Penicillium soppii]
MFAEFLKWKNERLFGQHGLILFGEPSPLTFALEDLPQDTMPKRQLHYSSESTNESHNLDTLQHDVHPSHLDTADIAYLQAKGAFVMPSEKTLEYFVTVFFTKFYPLYSIVEKEALKKALKIGKLPWILIHTVCFIGATFCDLPVIFKSGFDSRFEARKHYYTKAKLMFDTGYETGKVILLQSAIMLSFWGPHLQSYCNPCSWINIASTLAISLGLHRTATHSNSPSDKGLLRRLWWTLVVRDTFCSILLGRPFRINLSQCNTEAPNIEEFETPEDGFYQVQIGHLSLLLRDVVYYRFGPGNIDLSLEKIHANLDTWYLRIRISLEQWPNPPFKCSTAFELLYNYHVLLLYIESPSVFRRFTDAQPHPPDPQPGTVIESSAIMIASHAINLVSKVEVCDVPHELYPAFFVAGTVLYRQSQNAHPTMSQMSRAHLDNCRTVLNQIRESWDPGNWAMHIFDFLCSDRNITARSKDRDTPAAATQTDVNSTITVDQAPPQSMLGGDITLDLNLETMMNGESAEIGDYLLMPNFLLPAAEGWPALQL